MPDEQIDDLDPELEALLGELDPADIEPVTPPSDVWAGIERRLADEPAPVIELTRRRNEHRTARARWLLPVAAAAVLVVGGVAAIANRSSDENVLATAQLSYDPDEFDPLGVDAAASARLVERDGIFEIVIDAASLPAVTEDADLQLWLIETDDIGNIVDVAPVGLVAGAGTYAVPTTLDVSTHRIVDISVEPRDGDDAHSGRSILRGTLTDA